MTYFQFIHEVEVKVKEEVRDDVTVYIHSAVKNNGTKRHGLTIAQKGINIFPTIYLEGLYEEFKEGARLSALADKIINCHEEQSMALELDMDFFRDFDRVKDRIFYKLVSYEKNRKFLKDTPHINWNDLAVTFYYAMEKEVMEGGSIAIRRQHMLMWKQNAESLYRLAARNTKRGMPELLVSMRELVMELTGAWIRDEDALPMYVLTNREKRFGAAAMLYSERIRELAEKFGSDLLILPSSVHEVLLIPDDRCREYSVYRQMVEEVNRTQVAPEEVLSYGLYRYCRRGSKIEEIIS